MQGLIEEVLLLQDEYDARNTSAMKRRGELIRREMRAWISGHAGALETAVQGAIDDLRVEGRDGTGQKTEIPWIRVYSDSRSPSATTGWYIVYLFSAWGDRCYLALVHGSTTWDGVEFRPRPLSEVAELVAWARNRLRTPTLTRDGLVESIQLDARRSPLGPAYEASTAVAIGYPADEIPESSRLLDDLVFMLGLLVQLYGMEDQDPHVPGAVPPEVRQLVVDIDAAAGKDPRPRRGGQRFGLSKAEQRAVERHAVDRALQYYTSLPGWTDVADVGDHESYDVRATYGSQQFCIEVKGTMSAGESIILTKNEVELHCRVHPRNALFLVHSINLDRSEEVPTASGGTALEIRPWVVETSNLTPLAYQYRLGALGLP